MTNYSFEPAAFPAGARSSGEPVPFEPPIVATSPGSDAARPVVLPEFGGVRAAGPQSQGTHSRPGVGDLEHMLEQARSEAHRRGVIEGQRTEAERVRTAIEAVRAVVDELGGANAVRDKSAGERIAVLATAVASHLVEREVRVAPEIMSDLVRRAVAEFPVNETLTVHLNPSDLALLSSGLAADSPREHMTGGQVVNWVPDPAIRTGGCLVEGGNRIVDARLSRILDRIVQALTDD